MEQLKKNSAFSLELLSKTITGVATFNSYNDAKSEVNGGWKIKRDFLHMNSAINMLINLKVECLASTEVFNISSGKNLTLKQASTTMRNIFESIGKDIKIVYNNKSEGNSTYSTYPNNKILSMTEYQLTSFEAELNYEINRLYKDRY